MKKLVIFLVIFGALFANNAPNSLKKFNKVLAISKLQAPTSHYDRKWGAKYGKFKDFSNKYFYLSNDRYMTFFMCQGKKEKRRSELRFRSDWKTSTKKPISLKARLKVLPMSVKSEFTFLQIHSDGTLRNQPTINLPLLRIVWKKAYKGVKNHIWAVIRLNPKKKRYEKIDLGTLPKDFFTLKMVVLNSNLYITIGDKTYKLDVSYWNRYENYYKAGVYLQSEGCAKVLFDNIDFYETL